MIDFDAFLASIPDEPILGFRVSASGERQLVTYPGEMGLLTVAPNRKGKGVSVIGTNAICHRASFVCFDPKAELAKEYAWWRAVVLRQPTYVYDPLHAVDDADIPCLPASPFRSGTINVDSRGNGSTSASKLRAGFNPVEMVRQSPYPVADAKMVAGALIPVQGQNPFWSEASQSFFAAYTCFVALHPYYPEPRTMKSVWRDLTQTREKDFLDILKVMAESDICHGFVAGEAIEFMEGAADTVRGIRKTLKTQAGRILDDPQILESLSYTTIDFGMMQRQPTSLFIVLPGNLAETYNNFFRVLLTCMFAQIERAGLRPPGDRTRRTLIMLDEFATLRRSEYIREAVPRLPGYGVQFWPFVQDFNQLNTLYGKGWETFVSNAGVVQNFGGTSDPFTTEYLSKMSGTYGGETVSINEQTKGGGGGRTTSMAKRPGIMPHEFATLNATQEDKLKQVLFYSGHGYTFAQRLLYYEDFPEFTAFSRLLKFRRDGTGKPATAASGEKKAHWSVRGAFGEPKKPDHNGHWRTVDSGEIFQPGGHFRMDINGGTQVWVPGLG